MNVFDKLMRPMLYTLYIGSAAASVMLPSVVHARKRTQKEKVRTATVSIALLLGNLLRGRPVFVRSTTVACTNV